MGVMVLSRPWTGLMLGTALTLGVWVMIEPPRGSVQTRGSVGAGRCAVRGLARLVQPAHVGRTDPARLRSPVRSRSQVGSALGSVGLRIRSARSSRVHVRGPGPLRESASRHAPGCSRGGWDHAPVCQETPGAGVPCRAVVGPGTPGCECGVLVPPTPYAPRGSARMAVARRAGNGRTRTRLRAAGARRDLGGGGTGLGGWRNDLRAGTLRRDGLVG